MHLALQAKSMSWQRRKERTRPNVKPNVTRSWKRLSRKRKLGRVTTGISLRRRAKVKAKRVKVRRTYLRFKRIQTRVVRQFASG